MRAIIVSILALFLAALVVRNALFDAYVQRNPAGAAAVWPDHPSVILTTGLTEVGAAAATGRQVNPATIRRLLAISAKAPLAPEPFLVRGVETQLAGDQATARKAFGEARRRDPRSIAARYFLAEQYLKTGQVRHGLSEISALSKLVPGSLDAIAPHLAAFARVPGGAAQVRTMLREQPYLEPLLLGQLVANSGDARLALSIWSGRITNDDRGWQQQLVTMLVSTGRFQEARAAWSRFNPGRNLDGELVDAQFEGNGRPPFGWSLASGPAGVAEPEAGGKLHVLYYGRDDLTLASQLLLLKPGNYRLTMVITRESPAAKSLVWIMRCLPASRSLASVDLASAKNGTLVANIAVPPQDCEAQQLDLAGIAPELPEQVDLTIADLSLSRIGR